MPEAITQLPEFVFLDIETAKTPETTKLRIEMDCTTVASKLHPNRNEDAHFFNYQEKTFGVFDGTGKDGDGQEASRIACQVIQEYLESIGKTETLSSVRTLFKNAHYEANQEIFNFVNDKENHSKGAGSTGVFGTIIRGEDGVFHAIIANTGDSRAYIFRDGILQRITQDQNKTWLNFGKDSPQTKLIQDKIDSVVSPDQLTPLEQEAYKERNVVVNQMGYLFTKPDIYSIDIHPGDILLFSTDGVHDNLTTRELQSIILQSTSESAEDITKKIIDQSVIRSQEESFRSKPDDMTALVVKISDPKESVDKVKSLLETDNYSPKIGDLINIDRGSNIDSGWRVHYINRERGYMMVEKRYKNGHRYSEKISFDLAKRLNTPIKPEYISQSQDFAQLFFTLDGLNKIKNSIGRGFSSSYLKEVIRLIRNGQTNIDALPRIYELRETVSRLLQQE